MFRQLLLPCHCWFKKELEIKAAIKKKLLSKISAQIPAIRQIATYFDKDCWVRISEELEEKNLFHQAIQIYTSTFNNARIPEEMFLG